MPCSRLPGGWMDVEATPLLQEQGRREGKESKAVGKEGRVVRRGQYVATLVTTLGSFCLGTVLGWPAPVLPQLEEEGLGEAGLTLQEATWAAALPSLGGSLVGPLAGLLTTLVGRKVTMLLLLLPVTSGWLLLATTSSLPLLYLSRLLLGCAAAFSTLAPSFIGEVAEVEVRGALASVMQVMTMLGMLFTYVLGAFLPWRALTWACLALPLAALPALALLPNSPVFLLQRGRGAEARAALHYYRGPDTQLVEAELVRLRQEVEAEASRPTVGLASILATSSLRRPLLLATFLMLLQQLSGIRVVTSYMVGIFRRAGTALDANTCSMVTGGVQVLGTVLAAATVERCGRRPLLLLSSLLVAAALALLGTYFLLQDSAALPPWLPLAALLLFSLAYSLGLGPLPWLLNSELFTSAARPASSAVGATVNWLAAFLVVKAAPLVEAAVGSAALYLGLAAVGAAGGALALVALPETRGRTEGEVAAAWGAGARHGGAYQALT